MIEIFRHIDYSLFHFINHYCANSFLDFLCPILREKWVWAPFYALAAFYFYRIYGTKALCLALLAVVTIVLSDQISSTVIKPVFHRLRPCNNPELASSIRRVIHDCGAGFSFVSSHAANHFALATFFSFLLKGKKKIVLILFLWAAAIAFSQVYIGVHFPLDVIAGALLGFIIGTITGLTAQRKVLVNT